ncbi:MAG: AraC family transcriptional regulator [Flavobacteriaceae bacterium]|nr:AraC family transcriptional regulator [Flavobacteriaceae bacterium]
MRILEIDELKSDAILEKLNGFLEGDLSNEDWGEQILHFENGIGSGSVRSIDFDWGVSLIDYDVCFTEDVSLVFSIKDLTPIIFFFISEGSLEFCCDEDGEFLTLNQYQNVIISNKENSANTLKFPAGVRIKVNFIQIIKKNYLKKKHHNLDYLQQMLLPVVKDDNTTFVYYHLGNYSLRIADAIKKLKENHEGGIIRTLSLEGQLNLILALQLMEHRNYLNKVELPENISLDDMKRIYKLSEFIENNISEPLTVAQLATEAGLSSKKLQTGFQVLYSNSVNVHIRLRKLEVAMEQLRHTDLTISEIVYSIGFKSRSYFSKIFQERYGILPTDYRKKLKTRGGVS